MQIEHENMKINKIKQDEQLRDKKITKIYDNIIKIFKTNELIRITIIYEKNRHEYDER